MNGKTGTTRKNIQAREKKLREDLRIGERVYILAERIKKKSAPGKFYKQSVQNISYFNKDTVFTVRKKLFIDGITFFWLKNTKNNKNVTKKLMRSELSALSANSLRHC